MAFLVSADTSHTAGRTLAVNGGMYQDIPPSEANQKAVTPLGVPSPVGPS